LKATTLSQYSEVNGDDDGEASFVVVTVVVSLLLFVEGVACVVVLVLGEALTPELLIPLSHLHNVIWLSPFGVMSSIPAAIVPFNGASTPVELVWKTSIIMPLPPP
jgi:hypothetical protein